MREGVMKPSLRILASAASFAVAMTAAAPSAQTPATARAGTTAVHARQVKHLLIKNTMVIPGPATPAYGPIDILAEDGVIARMGNSADERWPGPDAIGDATGKYVLPRIVHTPMHRHEERLGPVPLDY